MLLDTGAFVALLDRSESQHERCLEFYRNFRGGVFTTEPVLTEALYLLGPSGKAQRTCLEFILNGGATLVPQSAASLSRAAVLIEKYHDVPMDFADATLVVLGEEAGMDEIFTLDRRGFETFRMHGRKTFKIRPE
jgi:predicted nucleic acid-binding protein